MDLEVEKHARLRRIPRFIQSDPGENATILHYTENDRRMQSGELLLIDAGAEYRHYCSDITRTIPVDDRPAIVLVLSGDRADELRALAVWPDCGAGRPGLIAEQVLPRP